MEMRPFSVSRHTAEAKAVKEHAYDVPLYH